MGRVALGFAVQARDPEPGLPAVEVTLVTYRRGDTPSGLAAAAAAAGVPLIEIPEKKRWDLKILRDVRAIVTAFKPDILETHNVKSHFLVRANGLHRQFPWVAWNHGYTSRDRLDRAYTQLDRWSLPGAFRVITVCWPLAGHMQKLGVARNKITVLHNYATPYAAPDPAEIARLRQQLGLNDELVVLSIGRMSREKGHTDLVGAIALLKHVPGLPPHRFVLVGEGPEEEELRRQAQSLGIEDRIIMPGFHQDVAPYYAIGNIFALPSHSEGSPNVVLEAMFSGLPIAATDAGGVPEILEHDVTGLLVPKMNPQALADAIQKLLQSEHLRTRLASAARRQVETAHTIKDYRRDLTQFYVETLKMRNGQPGFKEQLSA
jgi:glycosyltransferase involved in cell wall biosynthesis